MRDFPNGWNLSTKILVNCQRLLRHELTETLTTWPKTTKIETKDIIWKRKILKRKTKLYVRQSVMVLSLKPARKGKRQKKNLAPKVEFWRSKFQPWFSVSTATVWLEINSRMNAALVQVGKYELINHNLCTYIFMRRLCKINSKSKLLGKLYMRYMISMCTVISIRFVDNHFKITAIFLNVIHIFVHI